MSMRRQAACTTAGATRAQRMVDASLARRVTLARVAFGVDWAIDAALKWRPGFVSSFAGQVTSAAVGQPSWLHPWFSFWASVVSHHPHLLAYATALVESLIALGLIAGLARRATYVIGFVWSLGIWSVPEGFGGPYTAQSTDIGTGMIYAFLFVYLYTTEGHAASRSAGLDHAVEQHVPRWRRLSRPADRTRI